MEINVVAPVQVVTSIAPSSATANSEFTVSASIQSAKGTLKNVSVTLQKTGGSCTLQNSATKFIAELTSGVVHSLSWRLSQGSDTCSYGIDISASAGNSVFGISGSITGSVSSSGGGGPSGTTGGGGGAACIVEGAQSLDSTLMICVLKELGLVYKQFFTFVSNAWASIQAITGDYTNEFPAPVDVSSRVALAKPVNALEGDVYELTAKQVRKKWAFVNALVITRGDLEVDSLAAVAYAKAKGYPILLVKPKEAPAITLTTVKQLGPTKIIIAGGPVAVSNEVEAELKKIAATERIWGNNREETAIEMAKSIEKTTEIKMIVITDGLNANSDVALLAASYKAPVLYTTGSKVSDATKNFLLGHKTFEGTKKMKVVFVGVPSAAKTEIENLMK